MAGFDFGTAGLDLASIGDMFAPQSTPPLVAAPTNIGVTPSGVLGSLDTIVNQVGDTWANVLGNQAKVAQAQYQLAVTQAAGKNAVQTAHAGLPSANILVLGGFALLALLVLKSGSSSGASGGGKKK